MGARKRTLLARLLRRVSGDGCVIWTGSTDWEGYGRIGSEDENSKPTTVYVHRAMWEFVNQRPVPEGMQVLHVCDRPSCLAPWHLRLGTHTDNMIDRDMKDRTFQRNRKRLTPERALAYQSVAQRRRRAARSNMIFFAVTAK